MMICELVKGLKTFAHCGSGEPAAAPDLTPHTLTDGSFAVNDSLGNVIYLRYASGVTVRRHPSLVFVRTVSGECWIAGLDNVWLRVN